MNNSRQFDSHHHQDNTQWYENTNNAHYTDNINNVEYWDNTDNSTNYDYQSQQYQNQQTYEYDTYDNRYANGEDMNDRYDYNPNERVPSRSPR